MTSIQSYLLKYYFQFQQLISPPPKELNLPNERATMEGLAKMFKPLAELKFTKVDVNGVPGEWITPPETVSQRTVLYLHGGYYLLGSVTSHRNLAGNIAAAAKARALIIDYRLAPEHPFPAGLEDAVNAYTWLLGQGIPAEHIFIAGDSAGGGLVLATLLALREQGKPLPAGGVCISPATDLTMGGESWKLNAKKEFVVNRYTAMQIKPLYLKDTDPCHPLASPLFADLHGLPPLLIQVGSDECLLSDSTSFAQRAQNAGVDVTLEVWPKMFHVWQYTASFLPEARKAINHIGDFISNVSELGKGKRPHMF
jgi:acetyl esterase/lipase